jgi:hypothetical protein
MDLQLLLGSSWFSEHQIDLPELHGAPRPRLPTVFTTEFLKTKVTLPIYPSKLISDVVGVYHETPPRVCQLWIQALQSDSSVYSCGFH